MRLAHRRTAEAEVVLPATARPPRLEPDGEHIQHRRDAGDDRVGDDPRCRGRGELHAETAVDDAEEQDDATKPNVRMADSAAHLVLLVVHVVHQAKEGLDDQEHAHDGAEDGVRLLEKLQNMSVSRCHILACPWPKRKRGGGKLTYPWSLP